MIIMRPPQETTEGVFAPWAIYKEDFQKIGGNDTTYYLDHNQKRIVIYSIDLF